jgi:hypothetical protein
MGIDVGPAPLQESPGTWRGRPLEELSREELIEAIVQQANECRQMHSAYLDALHTIESIVRPRSWLARIFG